MMTKWVWELRQSLEVALKRGPSRYSQEALFADGVCWAKAVKSEPRRGVCSYHYRRPCVYGKAWLTQIMIYLCLLKVKT